MPTIAALTEIPTWILAPFIIALIAVVVWTVAWILRAES